MRVKTNNQQIYLTLRKRVIGWKAPINFSTYVLIPGLSSLVDFDIAQMYIPQNRAEAILKTGMEVVSVDTQF